jgi:MFS family permease
VKAGTTRLRATEAGVRRISQLLFLTSAAMGGMFARAAIGPVQEMLQRSLALTDNQVALLQGPALAVPLLLFSFPLGYLIDRYSRRAVLVVSSLCNACATLAGACVHTFSFLVLTRFLVGLCAPATAISAYSLLGDIYKPAVRGRATMFVVLGQIAGTASAFAVGGELLTILPMDYATWRAVMLMMGALLLLPTALALAVREPPRTGQMHQMPSWSATLTDIWALRNTLITLVVGMAMVSIADGAALVWTAPALSRQFGLPASSAGEITGLCLLIGGASGPLLGGPLADMSQGSGGARRTVLLLGMAGLLSVPAGLYASASTVTVSIPLLVLFLMLGSAMSVVVITLSIIVIPNPLRGTTVAIQSGAGAVFGLGLAPLLVSRLSGPLGGPAHIGEALSAICAGTSLLGALIFLHQRRNFPPF